MLILLNNIRTFVLTVLLVATAQQVCAQDLLARQAPVDRRMKVPDTLALRRMLDYEDEFPSIEMLNDWGSTGVHNRKGRLPEKARIDLRGFTMPTVSRVVTSNYGPRWGRRHEGLDLKVYTGDTIRSAFAGTVRIVKYDRGYGRYIVIRHNNGLETVYGHLSKQLVSEGQTVESGEVIGLGGNTGRSTGSHLHFETLVNGIPVNPALMFDFYAQDVTGDFFTLNLETLAEDEAEATALRGKIGNGGYTRELVQGANAASVGEVQRPVPAAKKQRSNSTANQYHKVKQGETLSSIARKRGTTVDNLCRLNGIKKTKKLQIGMMLRYS